MTAIAANSMANTAYAVRSDGTVWAWGDGSEGMLGDGQGSPGGPTDFAATPQQVPNVGNIKTVSTGVYTTYATTSSGAVVAWGLNNFGTIGNSSVPNSQITGPVAVNMLPNIGAIVGNEAVVM